MPKRKRAEPVSSSSDESEENPHDSEPAKKAAKTAKSKLSSTSQIRSRLAGRVQKDIQYFQPGDVVIYVNLPATLSGKLQVVHSQTPPQQVLAALKGIQKELPRPDPRLDAEIDKLKKVVAVWKGEPPASIALWISTVDQHCTTVCQFMHEVWLCRWLGQ